jgi:hypothetical protein
VDDHVASLYLYGDERIEKMDGCVVFRDSFTLSTSSTNFEESRGKHSIMCLHTAISVTDNTHDALFQIFACFPPERKVLKTVLPSTPIQVLMIPNTLFSNVPCFSFIRKSEARLAYRQERALFDARGRKLGIQVVVS